MLEQHYHEISMYSSAVFAIVSLDSISQNFMWLSRNKDVHAVILWSNRLSILFMGGCVLAFSYMAYSSQLNIVAIKETAKIAHSPSPAKTEINTEERYNKTEVATNMEVMRYASILILLTSIAIFMSKRWGFASMHVVFSASAFIFYIILTAP